MSCCKPAEGGSGKVRKYGFAHPPRDSVRHPGLSFHYKTNYSGGLTIPPLPVNSTAEPDISKCLVYLKQKDAQNPPGMPV